MWKLKFSNEQQLVGCSPLNEWHAVMLGHMWACNVIQATISISGRDLSNDQAFWGGWASRQVSEIMWVYCCESTGTISRSQKEENQYMLSSISVRPTEISWQTCSRNALQPDTFWMRCSVFFLVFHCFLIILNCRIGSAHLVAFDLKSVQFTW